MKKRDVVSNTPAASAAAAPSLAYLAQFMSPEGGAQDPHYVHDSGSDRGGDQGSLLDSLEDEDDCDSLAANSDDEDYRKYVDNTGCKLRDALNETTPKPVSPQPIHSSYKLPPPEPPSPKYYMPHAPRKDGLAFDMNTPWERSLLRHLERQQSKEEQRAKRDLMYVGHTESRDFAMDWENESTLSMETDTSSTIPVRAQFVHRTLLNQSPQPRVVGYQAQEKPDPKGTVPTTTHQPAPSPPPQSSVLLVSRTETSEITTLTTKDDRDDNGGANVPDHTPPRRRMHKSKAPKTSPKQYLEMELSKEEKQQPPSLPDYNPACGCLGNMFDYVLPPPNQTRRHSRAAIPLSQIEEETYMEPQRVDV